MWLDTGSSSNRASRHGNWNSLNKHVEMLKPLRGSAGKGTIWAPSKNNACHWCEMKRLSCAGISQGHKVSLTQASRGLEKPSYCDQNNWLWPGWSLILQKFQSCPPSHWRLLAASGVPVVWSELRLGSVNQGMHTCSSCHCFQTCHHMSICLILVGCQATLFFCFFIYSLFFSIIYQQSWSAGKVPHNWRLANVTPNYRKG